MISLTPEALHLLLDEKDQSIANLEQQLKGERAIRAAALRHTSSIVECIPANSPFGQQIILVHRILACSNLDSPEIPASFKQAMKECLENKLEPMFRKDGSLNVDAPAAESKELAALKLEFEKVAYVIEPHWKGAGAKLESEWMIKEIVYHGKIIDDLDEERDALKAELERSKSTARDMRPTWEFGSKVMNALVLPRALEMQPVEVAFEFLSRMEQEQSEMKLKLEVAKKTFHEIGRFFARPDVAVQNVLEIHKLAEEALSQLNESGVQESTTKGTLEVFNVIMDKLPDEPCSECRIIGRKNCSEHGVLDGESEEKK